MDNIEHTEKCPACWGNGFHQLVPEEEPLECSRCDGTGIVTPEHAAEIREEARLFVAKCAALVEANRLIDDYFAFEAAACTMSPDCTCGRSEHQHRR